jgi:hypothetical protein
MAAAKKEKSMESMRASIVAKLVMVVKTRPADSKPSIISTKSMVELIERIEEQVPGWVKKTAHLEKGRTFQSALQQAKNHDIDVSSLTSEVTEVKNKDKNKTKEGKKDKQEEWEELTIISNQLKCEQIPFKHVNNNSKGVVLTSWKNLRENFQRITSMEPLCFAVPGHFIKREGDEELDKLSWRHDELILSGKIGHPISKKVTLFEIAGKMLPDRCGGGKEEKDEDGVKGDALREVLPRAVYKLMSPQDVKEVDKDINEFMKNRVLKLLKYDALQVYGVVKRKEYVEQIVKMKTEEANKLISTQLDHNRTGIFLREVIRPGSNVAKAVKEESMILWSKDNKSLPELANICQQSGEAFIVFRPGEQALTSSSSSSSLSSSSLGIRVKNGRIAQVRTMMLKVENLPHNGSLSVKGRLVYIVDGLPEAFDPKEVITYLAKKGWQVLEGVSKNLKSSQLRVLADQGPPSRIYPNVATGKNIFIYEEGKRKKEEVINPTSSGGEQKEDGKTMEWEPPPLFEQEEERRKEDFQEEQQTSKTAAINPSVRPRPVSSSSSSSLPVPVSSSSSPSTVTVMREGQMAEEDKKRMEVMEKDMAELKDKISCLENNMTKTNEEIGNKFNSIEQQQAAANTDIKSMFAQLMSEIGTLKVTVSSSAVSTQGEGERKKPRVDSPAPMNS